MSKKTESSSVVEAMFAAGSHFGYSKTRRHPSVAKYIFTTKNKVDLVDLEKTEMMLDEAKAFIKELSSKGKQIVFVGVKPEARAKMREAASSIDMPFVTERWVGGAMTNFPEIKKRIQKLEELKSQREKGELDKYTKKERLLIDEQITKMDKLFLASRSSRSSTLIPISRPSNTRSSAMTARCRASHSSSTRLFPRTKMV